MPKFLPGTLAMLSLLAATAAGAQTLRMLTEEYRPYNYTVNNKLAGISTDVVAAMGRRAGMPMEFRALAWSDAYAAAQSRRDTCVYSTVRLENRERAFKWVGPLAANVWGLIANSGFRGEIKTLADARPYRIGGVADDPKVEWLRQNAVPNIVTVKDEKQIPAMLTLDRERPGAVDLWIANVYAAGIIAREIKFKDLKLVLKVHELPVWLACNPGVPDHAIKALADALEAMRKDGAYGKIVQSYEQQLAF